MKTELLPIVFTEKTVNLILEGSKVQTRRFIHPQPYSTPDISSCPFGKKNDRLWVRETWGIIETKNTHTLAYRADYIAYSNDAKWNKAARMPLWASRIMLKIEDIKAERIHDISLEDIKAEGVKVPSSKNGNEIQEARRAFIEFWEKQSTHKWKTNPWVWVITFKVLNIKTAKTNCQCPSCANFKRYFANLKRLPEKEIEFMRTYFEEAEYLREEKNFYEALIRGKISDTKHLSR